MSDSQTRERVFEELLVAYLDEQRRHWRELDIERSLYVQGQDWVTRYLSAELIDQGIRA